MTVILTRQRAFDSAVLMRNQAYEIAFVLREAQLLAVSGVVESSNDPEAYRRYGVQLNQTTGSYFTFRDANGDGIYTTDSSGDEQIGAVSSLDRRFQFASITAGVNDYQIVSITFERPNFDAIFYEQDGTAAPVTGPLSLSIQSVAGGAVVRVVSITSAGHIAVQSTE